MSGIAIFLFLRFYSFSFVVDIPYKNIGIPAEDQAATVHVQNSVHNGCACHRHPSA